MPMTQEQIHEEYRRLRAGAQEEAQAFQRAARERARHARHQRALERAEIPPKYQGLGFDGYHAELDQEVFARNIAERYAKDFHIGRDSHSPNLMLIGGSRCGKTHLACAIAEAVMDNHTAVVAKLSTILVECREVYRREDQTERDVLSRYVEPDLLVIDEVGEDETGNPAYRRHKIGYIIDERVENLRPTIVAGNITESGLRDYLGERTYNRLIEHSLDPVVFDWTPYLRRQRKAGQQTDAPPSAAPAAGVVMQGVFQC